MEFYGNNGYGATMESPAVNNFIGMAKIKVVGVGGAGNNAVDRLIESNLKGAEYYVVNTDNQTLARSKAANRIQIGVQLTKGLGAGSDPEVGRAAAEENKAELQEILKDTDLLFITAGMGGGTGTGAAPVIARLAKEMKILTVAVVTLPFSFEAKHKMDNAIKGMEELKKEVDSIITIPNDKIRAVVEKGTSLTDALKVADEVLRQGIRGITELIVTPSLINLDFADVKTTLKGKGLAHMGIGSAQGEQRILDAVRCAVSSPLLNTTIQGASSVILNVIGGNSLSLDEVITAADLIKDVIDYSANVIFGACIDEKMGERVEIVIIATGFSGVQNSLGFDAQNSNAQRAAELARSIGARQATQAQGYPAYAQPMQPQTNPAYAQPAQPMQPQTNPAYAQPAQPMQPAQTVNEPVATQSPSVSFEPNDPIPDAQPTQPTQTETADKKHRPGFVDFFMRRNNPEENK